MINLRQKSFAEIECYSHVTLKQFPNQHKTYTMFLQLSNLKEKDVKMVSCVLELLRKTRMWQGLSNLAEENSSVNKTKSQFNLNNGRSLTSTYEEKGFFENFKDLETDS